MVLIFPQPLTLREDYIDMVESGQICMLSNLIMEGRLCVWIVDGIQCVPYARFIVGYESRRPPYARQCLHVVKRAQAWPRLASRAESSYGAF